MAMLDIENDCDSNGSGNINRGRCESGLCEEFLISSSECERCYFNPRQDDSDSL